MFSEVPVNQNSHLKKYARCIIVGTHYPVIDPCQFDQSTRLVGGGGQQIVSRW